MILFFVVLEMIVPHLSECVDGTVVVLHNISAVVNDTVG
jgi:hypothetical protein